jgi:hypothetical protein
MLRLFLILGCCAVMPSVVTAQSRLDCPRPVRERHYRTAPKPYLEISAGFSRPLLYRNAAGKAGENYSFISRLTPYAAAIAYLPLSERLSVFGGVGITQTWQGMRFRYEDASSSMEWNSYAGATTLTIPLGLRYKTGERLQLSAGPYISYASHSGEASGSSSGTTGSSGGPAYSFMAPADKGVNFGLRLAADVAITRSFGISLSCAADALSAVASSSHVETGRPNQVYNGRMDPHLLHAAFGISYRFPGRSADYSF